MPNLSEVERGMREIIGARLAGAYVSRTANLMSVLRTTVSRVAYTNLGNVSSVRHSSGRKSKLKDRGRRMFEEYSSLKTLDYNAADNVRDEYSPSETSIHENY
ncbi:hypothetical protein TNCV_4818951 [Trichonephila clavipes]|nr:hypothetical protein TNCV_4818951 [Trichonephila clavipes]